MFKPRPPERPELSPVPKDALPPHSDDAEMAALGCVLTDMGKGSPQEQEALLAQMRPSLFYDLRNRTIFEAMVQIRMAGHALDSVTLWQWLKNEKKEQDAGGMDYIISLPDKSVSVWNFPTYLNEIREKALRRWTLAKQQRLGELAHASELTPDQLRAEFAEIYEQSEKMGGIVRPRLKIWRIDKLQKHTIPSHLRLIGDNEISMGYDGVVVIAGPGGSGKSLCTASLALAGAIGTGTWMGRTVHRRFKTLVIQAENGISRLKSELTALANNHPNANIQDHIFFSEPPEGGIPFHDPEFRTAVRRAIAEFTPDLIVLDPWSQVAAEDAAKDVVDKLAEIRSCFPAGDQCPGLVIVAHTKKPRAGEVHRGRSLTSLVSGSVALPNTSRCVYVLLPWSEEVTDTRVYWCCAKLNNGEMYAPSVWKRRMGTFFDHDTETNPNDWGKEQEHESTRALNRTDLCLAYNDSAALSRSELVHRLCDMTDAGSATVYRAISKGGYLAAFLEEKDGLLWLKKEGK